MKKTPLFLFAAAAFFSAIPAQSQYQYRSDDNAQIIQSILESKIPVQKQQPAAEATAPKPTVQPETAAKENVPPLKKTAVRKKKGGEIPPASGPDKVLLDTGINLLEAGNDPAAIEKFRQIKEKYSTGTYSDQASVWLARAYLKQGKYSDAIAETEKIAEDSGEYPPALYLSGQIFKAQKMNDKALDAYYRVSSRFPGHDLADNALIEAGKIYLSMKNGSQALAAAGIVVKSYPDRETLPDAYYLVGMVLEKDPALRDIEKARLVFKKFIYRAETEKADAFMRSPLLDRVRRELDYLEKNFFKTR